MACRRCPAHREAAPTRIIPAFVVRRHDELARCASAKRRHTDLTGWPRAWRTCSSRRHRAAVRARARYADAVRRGARPTLRRTDLRQLAPRARARRIGLHAHCSFAMHELQFVTSAQAPPRVSHVYPQPAIFAYDGSRRAGRSAFIAWGNASRAPTKVFTPIPAPFAERLSESSRASSRDVRALRYAREKSLERSEWGC